MKNFIFGKLKTYRIQTDMGILFDIGGRSYSCRNGVLTVKDCFAKVATFQTFKHIIEI